MNAFFCVAVAVLGAFVSMVRMIKVDTLRCLAAQPISKLGRPSSHAAHPEARRCWTRRRLFRWPVTVPRLPPRRVFPTPVVAHLFLCCLRWPVAVARLPPRHVGTFPLAALLCSVESPPARAHVAQFPCQLRSRSAAARCLDELDTCVEARGGISASAPYMGNQAFTMRSKDAHGGSSFAHLISADSAGP